MTALVPRDPLVGIDYAGTIVDLSPFVVAVDIASDAESIDIGTFATPKATDTGKITDSITLAVLWSPDLYTALQAHIGEEGALRFQPDQGAPETIMATVKYSSLPWGRFEVGARVEADMILAVLSELSYDVPPVIP